MNVRQARKDVFGVYEIDDDFQKYIKTLCFSQIKALTVGGLK